MKRILLSIGFLVYSLSYSQSGNTIENAIEVNGTNLSVNLLDYTSATASGLSPACNPYEDIFYKHTISSGDNKLEIGMASAGLTLIANINYQILKAPNGDLGLLQEIKCDSYTVVALAGGSFELIFDEINASDVYYLRVFKNNEALIDLSSLLSGTSITMNSSFDPTLSLGSSDENPNAVTILKNSIKLSDDFSTSIVKIYAIDGRLIDVYTDVNSTIDISKLTRGVYIMNMMNDISSYSTKFIKR
ncbi:T9SS type A sorting domain-containing protein [Winogradskyella algicola]|uniref:T9SS type A sorting domain-containing protein n=1 Tax=Winogradskyella algicola TaxID=2575815 RepID=UPI0011092EE7|nr:T9SS type A sorting domain-containing protein [Winogradskyella algicola]